MRLRRMFLVTLLAALAPCVYAQRMGSVSPHFARSFNRGVHPRSSFYPLAFSDPFYADYLSSTGYPVASQPPVILLQAPPAATPVADRFPAPAEPLMIELQGDRYVRISGSKSSEAETIGPEVDLEKYKSKKVDPMPGPPHRPADRTGATVEPTALPPAVLVFRDGHHEEASDYTIADGILYTSSDTYTTGSWNRKIALSALNLPETIASNQARGVRFRLPQSPNEVIVRP